MADNKQPDFLTQEQVKVKEIMAKYEKEISRIMSDEQNSKTEMQGANMILINKQLDKFKDDFGDVHIDKMHEAFPHLYDKNDIKRRDIYIGFDEKNKNLIVETTLGDNDAICIMIEQFIKQEKYKLQEQLTMCQSRLKTINSVVADKGLKEFTKTDCCRSMYDEPPEGETSNEGRVCIIPLNKLGKKFRKPEYQLFRVQSGFGTRPSAAGNACYGYFCADGEQCRWERFNFLGVANAEAEKIAEELEAGWSGGASGAAEREREPDEPEM